MRSFLKELELIGTSIKFWPGINSLTAGVCSNLSNILVNASFMSELTTPGYVPHLTRYFKIPSLISLPIPMTLNLL